MEVKNGRNHTARGGFSGVAKMPLTYHTSDDSFIDLEMDL